MSVNCRNRFREKKNLIVHVNASPVHNEFPVKKNKETKTTHKLSNQEIAQEYQMNETLDMVVADTCVTSTEKWHHVFKN